jgi:NADH-quinone oxidoreductase subunit K
MNLFNYLIISTGIYLFGVAGLVLNRTNILMVLLAIELMILGANLNFIIFSVHHDDMLGQIFALFLLTVAAAESAIGLAILVIYYRLRGNLITHIHPILRG